MPFGSNAAEDKWIQDKANSPNKQWQDKLATDPKLTTKTTNINSNGGVGNVPYGPPAPVSDGSYERAEENRFRTLSQTQQRSTESSSSGGGGGGSTTTAAPPRFTFKGEYPYNVAKSMGGNVTATLNDSIKLYNHTYGTDFALNSSGHIRSNGGTGSYMTPDDNATLNNVIRTGHASGYAIPAPEQATVVTAAAPAGWNEEQYLAENPGVAANVASGNGFKSGLDHYLKFGQSEGRNGDFRTKPSEEKVFDKGGIGPNLPNGGVLPTSATTANPQTVGEASSSEKDKAEEKAKVAKSKEDEKEKEEKAKVAADRSEEKRKDEEAKAKAAAAKADADEKQQQALAVATENKQSAKEARLKKIMEMRKPYMGGAASVGGSSDALVVPPITPASQVPPSPLP